MSRSIAPLLKHARPHDGRRAGLTALTGAGCREVTVAPFRQTAECGPKTWTFRGSHMRASGLDMEALAALGPRLAPAATGMGEVRPLSGGASQELWAISVEAPDGPRRLVLRRAPEGRVASGLSIP